MSFKDTLSSLDQLISRKNDFFYNTLKNYQDQLEPFSDMNRKIFIAGLRSLRINLSPAVAN